MTKTKSKTTKKPVAKKVTFPKTKMPKPSLPTRSGTAGRKGALGATSGY